VPELSEYVWHRILKFIHDIPGNGITAYLAVIARTYFTSSAAVQDAQQRVFVQTCDLPGNCEDYLGIPSSFITSMVKQVGAILSTEWQPEYRHICIILSQVFSVYVADPLDPECPKVITETYANLFNQFKTSMVSH
jgi:hypothetical protein